MSVMVWFQRDLRIHNNPALEWAMRQGKPVIAVYIHSPNEDAPWSEGGAARWWLHHSLQKLSQDLQSLGIRLQTFKQDSVSIIPQLVRDYAIEVISWSDRHEPARIACENRIHVLLKQKEIQVQRHTDGLLPHPERFLTASKETPYRVFTPFYRKLRRELQLNGFQPSSPLKALEFPAAAMHANELPLEQLNLLDPHPWTDSLHRHWTPGEKVAGDRLGHFIQNPLADYPAHRDFPAVNGTSGLSPHLHFGEISPQQIIHALAPLIEFADSRVASAAEAFLRQLIWREFARYILWHFPHTVSQPMNPKFSKDFWREDSAALQRWQRGQTGIPIIDAGMHQLWQTGSMHNRVRMLVASVLTKNMGIAWQHGARWFWDTLVDADLANNTMGWQWVAGCGVDAAPYFRIFNPETQTTRFDRKRDYIKQWQGHSAPPVQTIDLASSRKMALDRYQRLIRGQ